MRGHYDNRIAQALNIQARQVQATIELLDAGNTIPFIARYRKEATLNLDEFQLRQIEDNVKRMRALDERRDTILETIHAQGNLTEALYQKIENAASLTELEDLYLPYKPRRRTRASIAREEGLEPLAQLILEPDTPLDPLQVARQFLSDTITSPDDALAGARDIVAEIISDNADVRGSLRDKALTWGQLTSQYIPDSPDERQVYQTYYDFTYRVDRLRPYQILAINRGENEKILRVKIDIAERDSSYILDNIYRERGTSAWREQLTLAKQDALKRLLLPAIERDIRRELTQRAEEHAISVFADNLRGLLTQPPLTHHIIMGIDPAYRTGCKIAIIDGASKVLETGTVYPHAPQHETHKAIHTLKQLINKYSVSLIAIGNGTASRETEALIASITRDLDKTFYLIVNEAGASVYSASNLAREELPHLDVSLRGAVSIARRAQDPLAELVKIDPRSIGVGLYQHDINQNNLGDALNGVVESVVNQVGVDLNTASPALLQYVAGIGNKLAQQIVAHRENIGAFTSRSELKKVKGLGTKAFEQSAGFLRIREAKNPLDNTSIHPESYTIAKKLMQRAKVKLDDSPNEREKQLQTLLHHERIEDIARTMDVGTLTLRDIIEQLIRPARDPREDVPSPILRSDVLSMDDLAEGQHMKGTVRNCVDFGAFVDIGVKQDGLLHISQIPRTSQVQVGDIIDVQILSIDKERGRIGLGWHNPSELT